MIDDYKKSISDLSTEKLIELLKVHRANRRAAPVKKVTKKKKERKLEVTEEKRAEILSILKEAGIVGEEDEDEQDS